VIALLLPVLDSVWLVAAAMVAAAPSVGALWVPGLSLLSDGAEAAGVDQAIAFALMNMAWAGAQTLGASGGGSAADALGDGAVYGALTGVMALALLAFLVRPPAAARGAPVERVPAATSDQL
jgi:predicted MFS family arabinose efflux permease